MSKTVKIVLVVIGVLAMLAFRLSAMACSGLMSQAEDTSGYKLTGGVAATINGTNLTEDTVTKQIMSMRTSYGYTKDKRTGRSIWLTTTSRPRSTASNLLTPTRSRFCFNRQTEGERRDGCRMREVEKVRTRKSAGGAKAFKKTLKTYGYTEDTYKDSLTKESPAQKLKDAVAPTSKPKDSEIVDYINEKSVQLQRRPPPRRTSPIKVDSDASDEDKATAKAKAQGVPGQDQPGELSFEDAVEQ